MLVQLCRVRLFLLFQSPSFFFSRRRQRAERLKLLRRQSRVGFRAGLLHLLFFFAGRPDAHAGQKGIGWMVGGFPPFIFSLRWQLHFVSSDFVTCLQGPERTGWRTTRQLVNVFIRSVTLRAPFSNKNTGSMGCPPPVSNFYFCLFGRFFRTSVLG
jgi:hypothetical protein